MRVLAAIILSMFIAVQAAAQETLFVSERLFLGLYAEPDNGGERLALIPSGEAVTVLERLGDDARVRTVDGNEGWVRTNFLTAERPARARIPQLEARIAGLEREVARVPALEAELAEAREALEAEPAPPEHDPELLAAVEAAESRTAELAAELAAALVAAEQAGEVSIRELWPWFAGVLLVGVLTGFICGWVTLDRRIRKLHGGFRTW